MQAKLHEEYNAVQGPVQSNSARHHRKSLVSNSVIGFPNGVMVFGGRQGYGTPTLENAFQVAGSMCPLVRILMQGFKEDELGIQMPNNGAQAGKILPFTRWPRRCTSRTSVMT